MNKAYYKRRDRLEIYYNILSIIKSNPLRIEEKPLILKEKIRLNNQRLIYYIIDMIDKGFLSIDNNMVYVSEKGYRFMINYGRLLQLIKLDSCL